MPVIRSSKVDHSDFDAVPTADKGCTNVVGSRYFTSTNIVPSKDVTATTCATVNNAQNSGSDKISSYKLPIFYPKTPRERDAYKTKLGKRLTSHQWNVYDFILTIPKGKVATYKNVASAVGGSPRSVGNALRSNPFSPWVPCHRVIASNLFIGGFFGEWGKDHKTGKRYNEKLEMLASEGVLFSEKGDLLHTEDSLLKI